MKPGTQVPALDLPLTIGARYDLSKQDPETFTLVVMYRGKHCPVCKGQLTELGSKLDEFTKRGINVVAASMDSEERAMVVDQEWETGDVPLAYDMSDETAREWGLYISEKREGSEEPDKFSEPGMFLVRPDGTLYFASIQNAPFTRPPLDDLLEGIDYITKNDYPTRGTLT
ncbi:peroxiredoxin-like family protein [Erythrobacter sp. KY5]|uniref:peroxiredoxin-like family protein n=1 Tax=Erythrobacter sp. KY5 TaxID=2011159 RepID=UPI0021011C55|nr:peroxiredoxin-like family protein [Erythrobacter sp. KY5]